MNKNNKQYQILSMLRQAGKNGVPNYELAKIALRYGGYLGSLYKLGYRIHKEHVGDGVFVYTLVSEPEQEKQDGLSAQEKLIMAVSEKGIVDSEMLEKIINRLGVTVRHKAGTHQQY